MRKINIVALAALACLATPAAAETIKIGGTHSAEEIKETCKNVGGKWSGVDKTLGTYSCRKGGNVVSCEPDGKCAGATADAAGTSGRGTARGVLSFSGKAQPPVLQGASGLTTTPPAHPPTQQSTKSPGDAPTQMLTPQ